MSVKERRAAALALAIVGVALAARLGSAAPAHEPSAGADGFASGAAPPEPSAQAASPRLSGAQSKPVAPIAIDYEFSAQPELGVPFDVRIVAAGRGVIGDLQLTAVADGGLEAGAPQLTADAADGARRNWTLSATAFKSGTSYLTLIVQGTSGDRHPSRDLVIPIRIGASAAPMRPVAPQSAAGPAGRRVIVLPDSAR